MKRLIDIEELIDKVSVVPGAEMDQRTLGDALTAHNESRKQQQPKSRPRIGRIIMKSRMTKFAAAAVLLFAGLIAVQFYGSSMGGANVAWADVTRRFNDVDYIHFYVVTTKEDGFPSIREGWYAHGRVRSLSCGGYSSYGAYQSFDDGQTSVVLDRHNNITCVGESVLAKHQTFFEAATHGVLSFLDVSQFSNKTPVLVGTDFLIYDFEPPEEADWIEKVSVTVGRNSLMPIQIKTYYDAGRWYCTNNLLLFDYEAPQKPVEFFELPTERKPPHGTGQLVLGGDAVEIELHNAPGIDKAIVRLHAKFDGPVEDLLIPYRERYRIVGGPVYFMEITFVLDEGYRSITSKKCPLWLDQGVKAALGGDNWPDGKHRNIRYTPVLRATDDENVFMLELSCWVRTKDI